MRQRITTDQLQQLTPSQQDKLRMLWKPTIYDVIYDPRRDEINIVAGIYHDVPKIKFLPLLSIGQCIELCQDHGLDLYSTFNSDEELIDALWEAVKPIL